jgi:hypothetical protein
MNAASSSSMSFWGFTFARFVYLRGVFGGVAFFFFSEPSLGVRGFLGFFLGVVFALLARNLQRNVIIIISYY